MQKWGMHPENIKRSKRAKAALRRYIGVHEDTETGVVDLLADLRHFCDSVGLDFDNCDRIAIGHYAEEQTYNNIAGVKEWRPD